MVVDVQAFLYWIYQVIKELILGEWAKMDVLVRLICF